MNVPQETNRLVRAWIWFWYNDVTRFLLILLPGHFIITLPILMYFEVSGEFAKNFAIFSYMLGIVFAMCDNDYTNLHRIGLTTDRRKMR